MHDPMTLAFTIPNPFTRRRVSWRSSYYYESLIEIWHVDPERGGNDDSCDWFGTRGLTDADKDWLRKEARSEHTFFFRGVLKYDEGSRGELTENTRGERWEGGMMHASAFEVLYGIASIILWRMPVNGRKLCEQAFAGWRMRRALSAALPEILSLVGHSSDNLHRLIAEARACTDEGELAMGELFIAVARNLRRAQRPWWRHPRWHVHHWSIRVAPWENLKRWVTRRCADCGKRFAWGYAPVYDSNGYHHFDCIRKQVEGGDR